MIYLAKKFGIGHTEGIGDITLKDLLAFAGGTGFAGVVALWLLYKWDRKEAEVVTELKRVNERLLCLIASVVARRGGGEGEDRAG